MKYIIFIFSLFFSISAIAQTNVEGYVYESNNRGYLQQVKITIYELPDNIVRSELVSDADGRYVASLSKGMYRLSARKDIFFDRLDTFEVSDNKVFLKTEMRRKPGYMLDATIAEARETPDQIVDAVEGATIEVYNRTLDRPEITLKQHPEAFFQYTFEQGSHYTMLVRKPGFLAKRIEVYVNVKGCIICIDGIRSVTPGVTDNLTEGNTMGTLLGNIELVKAKVNKRIALENIYYDYDKYDIRADASEQLDKVVTLMNDNPGLKVELGSHTDSRGNDAYNEKLSENRAIAAVAYIVKEGIDSTRITAKGYGEIQITNRCKNGVVCSDLEHERNRRTELRITGVSEDELEYLKWPTLEQIVVEEKKKGIKPGKK